MQIELKGLEKTYPARAGGGSVRAVRGVSLSIPSNTIYGIIGKSGAGKSSLMRLVSLLEKPDSGAVYYGEERVDNLSKRDLIFSISLILTFALLNYSTTTRRLLFRGLLAG